MLTRQSLPMHSLGEDSNMASDPTGDEVARARHDGKAFGREIGERAMGEVRRVALTLAEVTSQQAQLKSVGPRASRAIDVGAMGKRQEGMKREAAMAWADGAAAGFEAAMNEAASTPEDNTAAAGSCATAGLHEAGYAYGCATAQNAAEAIQSARSKEDVDQAVQEAKRALVAGLRAYAIDHHEADVDAWSRGALAAYEDRMKHVRLVAGPAS